MLKKLLDYNKRFRIWLHDLEIVWFSCLSNNETYRECLIGEFVSLISKGLLKLEQKRKGSPLWKDLALLNKDKMACVKGIY